MASRKRKNQRNKKSRILKMKPVKPKEILSDTWYTNKQVWKILGISPATCKRWRRIDWLKSSKRGGKIYFNAKHVQDLLKGGLPKVIALICTLIEFSDSYDLLLGAA